MNYSKDKELGQKIEAILKAANLETPMVGKMASNAYQNTSKNFNEIMFGLGLDLTNDSLKETPNRVAKMFTNEIFYGLNYENFPACTTVDNAFKADEMVMEKGVSIMSFCEHHFLPFIGEAKIAYIPSEKVLGLSKINRVADFFSRRPQIQERLTLQIYHALKEILGTDNIAVQISATHFCVKMRGIKDTNCNTVTSKLGGVFKDRDVRNEFLNL